MTVLTKRNTPTCYTHTRVALTIVDQGLLYGPQLKNFVVKHDMMLGGRLKNEMLEKGEMGLAWESLI